MAKKGKYAGILPSLPKMTVKPDRAGIVQEMKDTILNQQKEDVQEGENEIDQQLEIATTAIKRIIQLEFHAIDKPYASEFARVYAELRKIRDSIVDWDSSFSLLIESFQSLMIEQFEIEGITSLKLANGQPVTTYGEPYAQIVDAEKFRAWCVKNDLGNKLTLPWSTTNMITKELLMNGEPAPDGVEVYAVTKVRLGGE